MAYRQLSLDQVTIAATGFKGPEGVTVYKTSCDVGLVS